MTAQILRIGMVCPYAWDSPGGVRSHVADLAAELRARGHFVDILAPVDEPDNVPAGEVTNGGKPVAVPYNGSVARLNFGLRATRQVRRWIQEGDFDLVHVHEPIAPGLSLLTLWVADGPIVATWHSSNPRSRILASLNRLVQTAMEKVSGRIAVSEDARRTLVAHLGGDAVLIPNGVRIGSFDEGDRHPDFDANRPTMLFLGRLDESRKGLSVLTDALPAIVQAVPDAHLFIAGPGDADDIRESIPAALQGHITFLGMVSDEEKAQALRSADMYIAPNTGGESFGIVLIEAMAAGTAVLASDLPAFTRVLDHGTAGAQFTNEDSADLAREAIALLQDPARRRELAAAGSLRVKRFDWDHVIDDVLAVYASVTASGDRVTTDLRGQILGRFSTGLGSGQR
ncbi:MAG: glycosyltransferase family 4 protein [Candidatus Nanopelagicales bacterium]